MEYTLSVKLKTGNTTFFGPGPANLLHLIHQGLSLNQAAEKSSIPYSKAWRILKEGEKALGFPLLTTTRGGKQGGGSKLTPEAVELLTKYSNFQKEMYTLGDTVFKKYFE